METVVPLVATFVSPIVQVFGNKVAEWLGHKLDKWWKLPNYHKKELQKNINIHIHGPVLLGSVHHWLPLHKSSSQMSNDLHYVYVGDELPYSVEREGKNATLRFEIFGVDREKLRELVMSSEWRTSRDSTGAGVLSLAVPQIAHITSDAGRFQITSGHYSSVPLRTKFAFSQPINRVEIDKWDPDPEEFYRRGRFEIPLTLKDPSFSIVKTTPESAVIPPHAITRRVEVFGVAKDKIIRRHALKSSVIYCPHCGTQITREERPVYFCPKCGREILNA